MKFKNILDPKGQVFSLNKTDKIFKNKSLNNGFCRNDCWNIAETLLKIAEWLLKYCCIYWRFSLFIFGDKVDS